MDLSGKIFSEDRSMKLSVGERILNIFIYPRLLGYCWYCDSAVHSTGKKDDDQELKDNGTCIKCYNQRELNNARILG